MCKSSHAPHRDSHIFRVFIVNNNNTTSSTQIVPSIQSVHNNTLGAVYQACQQLVEESVAVTPPRVQLLLNDCKSMAFGVESDIFTMITVGGNAVCAFEKCTFRTVSRFQKQAEEYGPSSATRSQVSTGFRMLISNQLLEQKNTAVIFIGDIDSEDLTTSQQTVQSLFTHAPNLSLFSISVGTSKTQLQEMSKRCWQCFTLDNLLQAFKEISTTIQDVKV